MLTAHDEIQVARAERLRETNRRIDFRRTELVFAAGRKETTSFVLSF